MTTTRVVPTNETADSSPSVLSIETLTQGLNTAGLDAWETSLFAKMREADVDGDGQLTRDELVKLMRTLNAAKGGIAISSLDPDTDGDGKVEKWEVEVFERIKSADEDKSGSISVKELFGVIKKAAESDRQKRIFQKLLFAAIVVIVLLICAIFGVSLAAAEAAKESHVGTGSNPSLLTTLSGDAVQVDTADSTAALWDAAALSAFQLGQIKFLSFDINLGTEWVSFVAKTASVYKTQDDQTAVFFTPEGHQISLQRATQSGTILFSTGVHSGTTFAITDDAPTTSSGRALMEATDFPLIPVNRRRTFGRRASFLTTQGSFTLSAGTANALGTGGRI